jgi:hypothetical protein
MAFSHWARHWQFCMPNIEKTSVSKANCIAFQPPARNAKNKSAAGEPRTTSITLQDRYPVISQQAPSFKILGGMNREQHFNNIAQVSDRMRPGWGMGAGRSVRCSGYRYCSMFTMLRHHHGSPFRYSSSRRRRHSGRGRGCGGPCSWKVERGSMRNAPSWKPTLSH